MPKCRLCKNNDANQTGSHVLTYSLIKTAINQIGKAERGKELTFGISSEDFLSLYFGEKVLPEKLEEVLKRDVTDEDIDQNQNPFTKDNIVCRNCERRFTTIENYFLDQVQNRLTNQTIEVRENKKLGKHIILDEFSSLAVRLNLYIQIWRTSVSNHDGFKLDDKTEDKLRRIIDSTITLDLESTRENCLTNKRQITQFPISLTYAHTDNDEEGIKKTENAVYIDQYKEPHFFILNDFYLQFYCHEKHTKRPAKPFFKLNDILKDTRVINIRETNLVVNYLDDASRKEILFTFYRFIAEVVGKNYVKDFIRRYFEVYGYLPSLELIQNAVNVLTHKYIK